MTVDLPTGTVTFLFTDIEGSTQLVRNLAAAYEQVLSEHQRILRECFAAHHGREIDTQGDSFFVAFARAGDAVECAVEAQRALQEHVWPEGAAVRVRMGLHSGEPRATGERYVGFGVHRAARIGAVGHGGQILVSNATRELVEDDLPTDTRLRDLGAYELKDVERPEQLFQVEAEGLDPELPPLKARRVGGPHRRRRIAVLAALLVAVVGAAAVYWSTTSDKSSVGTAKDPITVLTPWYAQDVEQKAFLEVVRTFEQTTNLEVEVTPSRGSPPAELRERVDAGDVPTLAYVSPNRLAQYARDGLAKPLESLGIADDELRATYSRTWLDLGTVDGKVYALPIVATSKSLVWFRPRDFRRLGVTPPRTWDDLGALTKRLARAGEQPWAVGAEDWFTLTDWFENIYVRSEGPWKYDALFAGKLPFDDRSVIRALRRMTSILRAPYLAGGVDETVRTSFPDAVVDFFGRDPSAHLFMGGGFVGSLALGGAVEPVPVPGETIGVAPFPTIDARVGDPVVVGADFITAFADDEAVGEFLRYLTSPGAGRIWVSTGTTVSSNKRIPLSAYPNELVRTAARQVSEAKIVRFDGSDLLPGSLGAELGLTLQQVLRRPTEVRPLMREFQQEAARAFNG